jgi:hypothetical protein
MASSRVSTSRLGVIGWNDTVLPGGGGGGGGGGGLDQGGVLASKRGKLLLAKQVAATPPVAFGTAPEQSAPGVPSRW